MTAPSTVVTTPPVEAAVAPDMRDPGPTDGDPALGSWGRRVAATLVDYLLFQVLIVVALAVGALALAVSSVLAVVLGSLVYVGAVVFVVDQLVKQGKYGATLGKQLLGLRLVRRETGRPVGVLRSLLRPLVHVLDALPLYLGYLLPLVDRHRQTIADKAQGTLVLRVPRRRVGLAPLLLLPALLAVLSTASAVALERSGVLEDDSAVAQDTGVAPEDASGTPPTTSAPPAGTLPREDLAGRVAAPPAGFTPVPEDVTELGPLDPAQTAELLASTPEEVPEVLAGLQELGLEAAYGTAFETSDRAYTVLVYRFADPSGASALVEQSASSANELLPTSVPAAIAFDVDPEAQDRSGLFAVGSFAYEVGLFTDGAPLDVAEFEALLQAQYERALTAGG